MDMRRKRHTEFQIVLPLRHGFGAYADAGWAVRLDRWHGTGRPSGRPMMRQAVCSGDHGAQAVVAVPVPTEEGLAMKALLVVCAALACLSAAHGYEGRRADVVLLNGWWEYVIGEGNEEAETAEGQAGLNWTPVTLPGELLPWSREAATKIAFVWARRTFEVTDEQVEKLALLRWNYIALGATAFINGIEVGRNDPTGPYQVIVPPGVLRPGVNRIVLKTAGARGVPKARSGFFLIPAGFASCHKRGMPALTDDIWIDFADRAYMKWVLAIPDLAGSKVRIRLTPTGLEPLDGLTLRARAPLAGGGGRWPGHCRRAPGA